MGRGFSDYVPEQDQGTERASLSLAKLGTLRNPAEDDFSAKLRTQQSLQPLDTGPIDRAIQGMTDFYQQNLQAPQGERFFGSLSRLSGNASQAIPEGQGVLGAPANIARGVLQGASNVFGGLDTTARGIDQNLSQGNYLGAGTTLASGALNATLGAPGELAGTTTESVLGKDLANRSLASLPYLGDITAKNLAEFGSNFLAPATALERGGAALIGGALKPVGSLIGGIASDIGPQGLEKAGGALAGGALGAMAPDQLNYLNPDGQNQLDPSLGQRIAGGLTGAVLGSQVPGALRKAAGVASNEAFRLPGMGALDKVNPFSLTLPSKDQSIGLDNNALKMMGEALTKRADPMLFDPTGEANLGNLEALDKALLGTKARIANWFDRYSSLDELTKFIQNTRLRGRPLSPSNDVYLQARLYAGRGIAATEFLTQEVKPVLKDLNPQEQSILNMYLAFKDTNNKAIAIGNRVATGYLDTKLPELVASPLVASAMKSDPLIRDIFSSGSSLLEAADNPVLSTLVPGMDTLLTEARVAGQKALNARQFGSVGGYTLTAVDAVQLERDLEQAAGPSAQKIRDAATSLNEVVNKLRARMVEGGLISKDTEEVFRTKYPDYIPIDLVDYIDKVSDRTGTGVQTLSTPDLIKSLTERGTELNRDLPINSIIGMAYKIEAASQRNNIGQALIRLRNRSPEFKAIFRPVEGEAANDAAKVTRKALELEKGEALPPVTSPRDVILTVFQNGEASKWAVDKNYRNLFNFDSESLPAWTRIASQITGTSALRAGATELNPAFIALNAIRDARTYFLRNAAEGKDVLQTGKEYVKALGTSLADVLPEQVKSGLGVAPNADLQALRQQGVSGRNIFRETGNNNQARILLTGQQGSRLAANVQELKDAEDWLGKLSAAISLGGSVVRIPFLPVEALGRAIEQTPRLAQFRLEQGMGRPASRAAYAAREITMDFDRAGNLARTVNTFVPFFNVGLQGPERFLRRDVPSFLKNPKTAVPAYLAYVALPGLAAEAYNRTNFPNEYADVPDYLKETGQVLVLGRQPNKPDGSPGEVNYLYIPVPQEVRFLQNSLTNGIDKALRDGTLGPVFQAMGFQKPDRGIPKTWEEIGTSLLGSVSPVQTENPAASLTSPLGKSLFELTANRDFYRKQAIVPDALHALPPEEQVRPWNSALSRAIGKMTWSSPAKVEYFINSLTGGTGGTTLKLADQAMKASGMQGSDTPGYSLTGSSLGDTALNIPLGGVVRSRGNQVEESARDEVRKALPQITRNALAELRASPEYLRYSPAQQAEESRKLSLAVERLVIDSQSPGVFTNPKSSGSTFKYIMSKSSNDDLITDKALQQYNRWLSDPISYPQPAPSVMQQALLNGIPNPAYSFEQQQLSGVRNRVLTELRGSIPDYSRG